MKKVIFNFLALFLCCGMAIGQTTKLTPDRVSDLGIGVRTSSDVDLLKDNQPRSFYQSKTNSAAIIFEYNVPVKATYYTLTSADVTINSDPKQWVLKASIDGKNWQIVAEEKIRAFRSPHEAGMIGKCRFLRVHILEGTPGIWEMKFY